MAIDFPVVNSDPSLPWLNPDTGITYIYKDGAWRVLSSSNSEDLEDIYVNVSGDNMTGDLTLGTDKITLNATDGSASFTGGGGVGDTRVGTTIDNFNPNAFIRSVGLNSSAIQLKTFSGFGDDDAQITEIQFLDRSNASLTDRLRGRISAYNPNGTTTTGAYVQLIGGEGTDAVAAKIYEDGSATFAGQVQGGGINNPARYAYIGYSESASPGGDLDSTFWAWNKRGNGNAFVAVAHDNNQRQTAVIKENGSAVFASEVTIGSGTSNGATNIRRAGAGQVLFHASAYLVSGSPVPFAVYNNDGNVNTVKPVAYILPDGTGHFKGGTVSPAVVIELEPDNEDNYTVTGTEEYTETESYTGPLGNTLEREVTKTRDIRTYTGPTLDVKERLQNLIARLDAIEANEVVDDATDNSLLLAVAELTSRLNERDALITTLTTRIEALENA